MEEMNTGRHEDTAVSDNLKTAAPAKTEEVLSKAEDNILEEAYNMIQDEVTEIRSNINREISLHNMESRKEVLAEREHYIDAVFNAVKKQLLEFKKTDGYARYLTRAYTEGKSALGDVTRVYVSRPDTELVKKLFPNVPIRQDLRIIVGGIIIENDGLVADYSFDTKLKKEREKFKKTTLLSYDG